jgi:subtilase family serine protease
MSGTSFAAPIAAAMVAIIYQFYNKYHSKIDEQLEENTEGLKSITSVQHILSKMSTASKKRDYNYLGPPIPNSHFYSKSREGESVNYHGDIFVDFLPGNLLKLSIWVI